MPSITSVRVDALTKLEYYRSLIRLERWLGAHRIRDVISAVISDRRGRGQNQGHGEEKTGGDHCSCRALPNGALRPQSCLEQFRRGCLNPGERSRLYNTVYEG